MTGIVYKLLFIYKWFNSANLNQNTHINKPKLTYNKPLNENQSKPIPNKTADITHLLGRHFRSKKHFEFSQSLSY